MKLDRDAYMLHLTVFREDLHPRDPFGRFLHTFDKAASESVAPSTDYRISHTAPGPKDVPFHDIEKAAPDFYAHPEYYTTRESIPDRESIRAIRSAHNNPDAKITIFRAGPYQDINAGDWVTTSRAYAEYHSRHATDPTQDVPVWSATVPAKTLFWNGDSIHEFGYHGSSFKATKAKKRL